MNAFLKKEVRLLLPNLILAVAAGVPGIFLNEAGGPVFRAAGYFLACIFFPAMAVMLALNSFGVEVGTHTFPMMLAQPIARLRIWQTKISLLALALALMGVLWSAAVGLSVSYFPREGHADDYAIMISAAILFGLAVFSGGLWTVLLLRQVAAAFWFTLIVPGAVAAIVAGLCSGHSDEFILGALATALGLYSLAGFFFARWLFFRAQDLQWTGGAIVLPEWGKRARADTARVRVWRPRPALWWKEVHLHQSQYVIAFAIVLLHAGVLAARAFGNFENSRDLKFLLETFWGLWFVMPLLVGSAAVAEERKIGTLETQLCLPAAHGTQFRIKLFVVVGLSVVLGFLMPLLLEGRRILPPAHFQLVVPVKNDCLFWWSVLDLINFSLPVLVMAAIPVLVGLVSFYVSTMTRNTLQTLAPAVLGISAIFPLAMAAAAPWGEFNDSFWNGPLGWFIILPAVGIAALVLAFRNFRSVLAGWRLAARNLLTLAAVFMLAAAMTALVYHRFWEKFTAFEPRPGAPRLAMANPPAFANSWGEIIVRLPDGKVWTAMSSLDSSRQNLPGVLFSNFKMKPAIGSYLPGNWVDLDSSWALSAGIKKDGSLWVSDNRETSIRRPARTLELRDQELHHLVQYGSDTNWTSCEPFGRTLWLARNDGTLWRVGEMDFDHAHKPWPGLPDFSLQRLGSESDWEEVFHLWPGHVPALRKTNGTGWFSGAFQTNFQSVLQLDTNAIFYRVPGLDRGQMKSMAQINHGIDFMVGVHADGSFRIWADQLPHNHGSYSTYDWHLTDVQIGSDSNWVAVAGNWQQAIALRNDGTLWLWDFRLRYRSGRAWRTEEFSREIAQTVPVRLGGRSDWVAISGTTALAADGSLWFWPVGTAREIMAAAEWSDPGMDLNLSCLLDVSRKPQRLGNIFAE